MREASTAPTSSERGWGAAGLLAGLGLWELLAWRAGPLLLASPHAVAATLWAERSRLAEATGQTALGALGGLLLATALGLAIAIGSWASRSLHLALLPWTTFLQVVPIVAVAPLLVVWLGYGVGVAVTTSVIAAFYPVYSAAVTGLRSPSPDLVDLLRLYGAPRWRELTDLRLPAALPALFSGLRTAGGLAVIGGIIGEFVGSNGLPPTLGQTIVYAARSARTDLCFAAIACSGVLALVVQLVIRTAERRLVGRWFGS